MSDRTLLIVKPDAVAAGFADAIEKLIFANDFAVLAKLETTLSPAQVEEFYEEFEGTASYLGVVTLMSSGPIVALALEKTGGINALLELLGPENALLAKEMAPTSIRAVYGSGPIKNAAHGSDTPVAAFRELKFFFPKLFPREVTTLVVLPDAKDKAKDIIAAAAAEGFLCIAKKSLELTPEQAAAFYDGTADEETVAHLSSGAIEVVALEMPFAVESMLAMAGPADPADAKEEAPMSIRARYGTDAVKKAIHVSGTISAAAREAAFFFGSSLSSGETTFAWVKPDAFPKADVVIAIAEASGFTVLASEQVSLSKEAAADFASSPDEVAVMTSGPALALVLMRPCAVQAWLSLLGPADSGAAKSSEPLSLRAQFGTDAVSNACHGSASAAAAEKEAKLFFPHLFQPEQTLALIAPDAVPFSDELIAAAASAGLVVSESCVTTLDAARAAVVDPAAIAAEKRRKAKKREKQNAKIEEENKKKGMFRKKKQLKPTGEDDDHHEDGKGGWSLFGHKEEKVETGGLTKLAGIPLVDPRTPMPGAKELDRVWQRVYEVVEPGMCLHWEAGVRWIRHNRYVPPNMTHAAILMQYVVDARLDETLQEIFNEAAQPPMVKNPYPAVVQSLRATGHQFDVSFQLVGGDPLTGAGGDMTTLRPGQAARLKGIAGARPTISMVQPPHPVYAARAPEGSTKHEIGRAHV